MSPEPSHLSAEPPPPSGKLSPDDLAETLVASELRYRRLFETAQDGILILDAGSGMVVDVNPFLIKLLGFSREDFLGKKVWELGFFKDIVANQTRFTELQQKGYIRYEDMPLKTSDGRRIEVEFVSNVYQVNHHRVMQCNIRDNTAHKRASEALRASEKKFQGLFENTRDAIMTLEPPSWRFTSGNPAAVKMFGAKSEEEFISYEPWKLSPDRQPEGRASDEKAREMIETAVREGSHFFEWTHRRIGGGEFPVDVLLTRMEEGGKVLLHATVRDITERKQAEESHARLATAVEQAAETIMITDAKATILYVNPAFERTTGYTRKEALGQNPRLLKSGRQDAAFYRRMWDKLTAGEVWSGHMINRRKDGALYEEDATISPVRDAAGKIVNYVAVQHDVTHEVQLEAQLRQAQKMESVGRLAGGIAHDFNNLLMAIMGYSDITLQALPAKNPLRQHIEEIRGAGARAAALTRQLLAFSRKQVLLPRVLDLNDLAGDLSKMLRRLIGEDIRLMTIFDPALGRVRADPGQIEQVITNLAVNARDAMPKGGTLTLQTANAELDEAYASQHTEVTPGRYVLLSVTDTGIGMTDEVKAHLFEPFFTTKEQGRGTGLGLPTVYGIVKQSGGHITAYGEVGHGTTFKIYLPRVEEAVQPVLPTGAPAELPHGTETILLVEDEEQVRNLARMLLEECGYTVWVAGNGPDAIRLARQHGGKIQLLLTDVIMPEMSGHVLAPLLVALHPGLKVLYMSGYTDTMVIRQDLMSPGSAFLQKPFALDILAHKVREVLDAPLNRGQHAGPAESKKNPP